MSQPKSTTSKPIPIGPPIMPASPPAIDTLLRFFERQRERLCCRASRHSVCCSLVVPTLAIPWNISRITCSTEAITISPFGCTNTYDGSIAPFRFTQLLQLARCHSAPTGTRTHGHTALGHSGPVPPDTALTHMGRDALPLVIGTGAGEGLQTEAQPVPAHAAGA